MKKLKTLIKNQLLKGSLIILLGNIIAGFLNYLYHLITGRLLTPDQYGLLQSLIALTYFLGVFTQSFSFSVINLVSQTKKSSVFLLVKQLEKKTLKLSFILWLLFLASFPILKRFLHLKNFFIFFIFTLQLLFSFLPTVYLATLQARLKFIPFSLTGIFSSAAKTVSAFILILIGWPLKGALGGWLASGIVAILLGRFWIFNYWQGKRVAPSRSRFNRDSDPIGERRCDPNKIDDRFWRYSFLSLITTLALTSIYSTDILLVRHYFSPYNSGIYAAVSVLGKIIFFTASAILLVAFPLFSKFKNKAGKLKQTFNLSFLFLGVICLLGVITYKSFPRLVVSLLYGNGYQDAARFLPAFAIFISLFAIFNLLIQLLLALENKQAAWVAASVAISQIFLIFVRHSDLKIVINNSIISVTFGLLLGFFFAMKVIGEKKD